MRAPDAAGADPAHADPLRGVRAWGGRGTGPGRAVIFDFTGTLSDDEPLLLRLYTEMFFEHFRWRLTPGDYYARLAGRSDREIIDLMIAELAADHAMLADDLMAERRRRYRELAGQESPVRPATADAVRLLASAGIPLGIVTGAERAEVEFVLERTGIGELFQAIVTHEDVTAGKPEPEGFLRGSRQLGVQPAAVLAFEDSAFGLRAARAAGMRTIAVEGTRTRADLTPLADAVVPAIGPELFAVS